MTKFGFHSVSLEIRGLHFSEPLCITYNVFQVTMYYIIHNQQATEWRKDRTSSRGNCQLVQQWWSGGESLGVDGEEHETQQKEHEREGDLNLRTWFSLHVICLQKV